MNSDTGTPPRSIRVAIAVATMLSVVAVVAVLAVIYMTPHSARERAVVGMGAGLVLFWCVLGGALQRLWCDRIVSAMRRVPGPAAVGFVVSASVMALIEEAVATAMTNAAPIFGATSAEAYITPSTNWLHTVSLHSVVVFVPMFAVWAWLLGRRWFFPSEAMLLVGTNGLLTEWLTFGQFNPIWWFVYGLMVWLPARAFAGELGAGRPRPGIRIVVLSLVLPLVAAAPVVVVIQALHPKDLADLSMR